jgi:hypothetical protein
MYSRSLPDIAASTVNTTPDGSWESCSSPVRNSKPMPSGAQLLGERRELNAASEPLVLVHDDRNRRFGCANLAGQGDGPVELGPDEGAVEIFSAQIG